ncbi:MAG: hypothetical protein FRX49_05790 [Trebouxia sp. A1-2]|nr:MAG: hypothetical protein FRX49_05790 [Trebouxia sp. A1-2]
MPAWSRRGGGDQGAVIGHADIVQGASAHELLAVHRVDSPAWVARLPPGGHRLWLQLPHLHTSAMPT